jgi:hypothetical protein
LNLYANGGVISIFNIAKSMDTLADAIRLWHQAGTPSTRANADGASVSPLAT